MNWNRIYTINEYYDGPVLGVADHDGEPYIFQRMFDEGRDEWSAQFWLARIEKQLMILVLEDWEIWLRWSRAFRAGATTMDTHPALPSDRARHEELKHLIGSKLTARFDSSKVVHAHFRKIDADWNNGEVEWLP